MRLRIDTDGRVWQGDRELFELTEAQQDEVCRILYPHDAVVRDEYTTRKRATSYSGSSYGYATLTNLSVETIEHAYKLPDEQLLAIGGRRLLAIYLANCNLAVAAADLNIREDALRRWFHRWRQTEASQTLEGLLRGYSTHNPAELSPVAEGTFR